jgi:hypothetical protein
MKIFATDRQLYYFATVDKFAMLAWKGEQQICLIKNANRKRFNNSR